jgi:hypothetical protein
MKLTKITKNKSLHFELSDKRIGVVYTSGYVRVSTKGGYPNRYPKLYQINKKITILEGKDYYRYKRVLQDNVEDGVRMLYNFDLKNCR